ncbi:outer kinetochore KNL1 complex subunit ZWINT isoform X2 [Mixophyes fleayi]
MMCGQLQVLRFMLEFLQEADSAGWEETNPKLLNIDAEEVKQKWKALKYEYREKVKDVEEAIPQLLERIQLVHEKRTQLEESLQRYQSQKAVTDNKTKDKQQHLQEVSQKQQLVVEKCQSQIQQLKEELQKLEQSADSWIEAVGRDSTHVGLLTTLPGLSVVCVGEQELVLDVMADEKMEIPPLRVTLRWTSEERFQVETDGSVPGLPMDLQQGATSRIPSVLLELQCWYRSNGRLLSELRELEERYTIDWLATERTLLLLKGGKRYRLLVKPGYPLSGGVRLMSVAGAEPCVVPDNCKPLVESPSLSDWLKYLHNAPNLST